MSLPIDLGPHAWMFYTGGGLLLLGLMIMWRTSRYDLAGAAVDSAWQVATGGRSAENPTAIEKHIKDIASKQTVAGKAKAAAGTVVGHFFAKVMGVVSLIMMVIGAGLIALGVYFR